LVVGNNCLLSVAVVSLARGDSQCIVPNNGTQGIRRGARGCCEHQVDTAASSCDAGANSQSRRRDLASGHGAAAVNNAV